MTNLSQQPRTSTPVFYDCEASDYEGYPIEVGWAFFDPEAAAVVSESYLLQPPVEWPVKESWDKAAERVHGISFSQLWRDGHSVRDVAHRMNAVLQGRELFSDAHQDKTWLELVFVCAGVEPTFVVRQTDARVLISEAAAARGWDATAYARAKAQAAELAPRLHRAEADARHLAVLWSIVVPGTLAQ